MRGNVRVVRIVRNVCLVVQLRITGEVGVEGILFLAFSELCCRSVWKI